MQSLIRAVYQCRFKLHAPIGTIVRFDNELQKLRKAPNGFLPSGTSNEQTRRAHRISKYFKSRIKALVHSRNAIISGQENQFINDWAEWGDTTLDDPISWAPARSREQLVSKVDDLPAQVTSKGGWACYIKESNTWTVFIVS